MDLREALLAEHSKDQAQRICEYVGDDPKRFAKLIHLMTGPVYRVSQRAAWPVSFCVAAYPELIKPYFRMLLEQLEDDEAHPAVRRNVLRLLQFVEIPKRYQGGLFNVCCELVGNVSNPAAIRAFSLTVAANIANGDPGLLAELKAIATEHPSAATAALRVRLRKIFNEASDD